MDGGTHRWLRYLEKQEINAFSVEHRQYIPDLITGDMDSCSPVMIEKLKAIGSTVVETPDQDHTDYTKALLQVARYAEMNNINVIFKILVLFNKISRYTVCDKANDTVNSWVRYTCLQKLWEGSTISLAISIHCTRATN